MSKGRVWSSKSISEEIEKINLGVPADMSPFLEGKIEFKAADIVFEYTADEVAEIAKCASDVVYFGEKYCYSMTDEGVRSIKLREYQQDMLHGFQHNRFNVMLASRQIGKTVTSSIFIAWYLCFHYDRNVMIVANKMATTTEIVDKVKVILKNLPFFMKPGVYNAGATGMRFDNGCRLYSQATTKTAAIGFTIHLLYADEFAHIHANFLTQFYRSIYPTLSSSKISRIIISSTPNGMNLFYDIYQNAKEGKNAYNAIRVDWWQVPGRDEVWKQREIANLGSEELFNQEYGNQFLASSRLLLSARTLAFLKRTSKEYQYIEMEELLDMPETAQFLKWHPEFDPTASDAKDHRYVMSMDIGDGVGRDYTVINIFRLEPQSPAQIRNTRDWYDETSFYRLRQVGSFRSNVSSIEESSKVLEFLTFDLFNEENVKIVLEINFKGNIVFEKLSRNKKFYPEIFLHTKHSISNNHLKLGVKLQKDNKESYCRELRSTLNDKRIVITDRMTYEELTAFGLNSAGRYESQSGHDDTAMTCVNLTTFFDTTDFYELVETVQDTIDDRFKVAMEERMNRGDRAEEDFMQTFAFLREDYTPSTPSSLSKNYETTSLSGFQSGLGKQSPMNSPFRKKT